MSKTKSQDLMVQGGGSLELLFQILPAGQMPADGDGRIGVYFLTPEQEADFRRQANALIQQVGETQLENISRLEQGLKEAKLTITERLNKQKVDAPRAHRQSFVPKAQHLLDFIRRGSSGRSTKEMLDWMSSDPIMNPSGGGNVQLKSRLQNFLQRLRLNGSVVNTGYSQWEATSGDNHQSASTRGKRWVTAAKDEHVDLSVERRKGRKKQAVAELLLRHPEPLTVAEIANKLCQPNSAYDGNSAWEAKNRVAATLSADGGKTFCRVGNDRPYRWTHADNRPVSISGADRKTAGSKAAPLPRSRKNSDSIKPQKLRASESVLDLSRFPASTAKKRPLTTDADWDELLGKCCVHLGHFEFNEVVENITVIAHRCGFTNQSLARAIVHNRLAQAVTRLSEEGLIKISPDRQTITVVDQNEVAVEGEEFDEQISSFEEEETASKPEVAGLTKKVISSEGDWALAVNEILRKSTFPLDPVDIAAKLGGRSSSWQAPDDHAEADIEEAVYEALQQLALDGFALEDDDGNWRFY